MASSKKKAHLISSIASFLYFFLIIFQVSLFRVTCRIGICTTPIQVTSSQLIASEIAPAFVVKALIYPGAVANAIIKGSRIPSYDNLLKLYNFKNVKKAPATDLQRLEVLAGSYLSIAGAFLGLLRSGRMSLFGTLLLLWGLVKELVFRKSSSISSMKAIYIYPAMYIALITAFLSIKKDVRKIVRIFTFQRASKHHRSYSKSL